MKLKALTALFGLVLLLHWAGLTWLSEQLAPGETLQKTAQPLFTRLIEQTSAPAIANLAKPAPAAKSRPKKTASGDLVTQAELRLTPSDLPSDLTPNLAPNLAPNLPPNFPLGRPTPPAPPIDDGKLAPSETPSATGPEPAASAAAAAAEVTAMANPSGADAGPPSLAASGTLKSTIDAAQAALPVSQDANLALDGWPPDTRLTYRLSGNYRGELNGSARVQWQRAPVQEPPAEPSRPQTRYQVRLDLLLSSFVVLSMTSQGRMTDAGLVPQIYEEKLPGNLRRVSFDGTQVRFQNGGLTAQPSTVQDTASQFVELSRRFSSGREKLQAGSEVQVWLARPGGMDAWTYDVSGPHTLQTQELGAVQAFQLKPRPLVNPRGPISAEMWFAPSLQYLPVRVRIALGEGNFVDLLVERIEQGARSDAVLAPKSGIN